MNDALLKAELLSAISSKINTLPLNWKVPEGLKDFEVEYKTGYLVALNDVMNILLAETGVKCQ